MPDFPGDDILKALNSITESFIPFDNLVMPEKPVKEFLDSIPMEKDTEPRNHNTLLGVKVIVSKFLPENTMLMRQSENVVAIAILKNGFWIVHRAEIPSLLDFKPLPIFFDWKKGEE